MRQVPTSFIALCCLSVCFIPAALAGSVQTFVSSRGKDAGSCPATIPCRSFAYAMAQTVASGEIVVLDSAAYGQVTITKALTITSPPGIVGLVSGPSGATAITVNAGPKDTITLTGLTIDGNSVGAIGIHVTAGNTIDVLNCTIRNFTTAGIYTSTGQLFVSDTLISNASTGVDSEQTSKAVIARSTFIGNNIRGTKISNTGTNGPISNSVVDSIYSFNTEGLFNQANTSISGDKFLYQSQDDLNLIGSYFVALDNNVIQRSIKGSSTAVTFGNNRIYGPYSINFRSTPQQ